MEVCVQQVKTAMPSSGKCVTSVSRDDVKRSNSRHLAFGQENLHTLCCGLSFALCVLLKADGMTVEVQELSAL